MDNEMDWSEEETTYEETNYDLDNYQTNKTLSVYEDLKLAANNIRDKLVPYTSDSGYNRLKKQKEREIALKNKVDYILNNCEKFGFNQTNKVILENAIDEVIKPKSASRLLNLKKDIKSIKYNWVSKGLGLAAGDSIILVGESFCGKTHFATYLAVCIATGTPIFGKFAVDRKGEVAHLNYDSSDDLTETGYIRMLNGLCGVINHDDIKIHYEKPLWKFNQEVAYENLTRTCKGKVVCIVDSLRTCYDGTDENSSESALMIALANRVSMETGCAIIFIAHPGKGGVGKKGIDAPRGSSAQVAAAGTLWTLEKTSIDQVVKFDSTKKSRYGSKQVFHYRYDNVGDYCEDICTTEAINMTIPGDDAPVMQKKLTIREQVVAALKKGSLSSGDLNKEITGNQSSICDELKKMETEGHLKKEKDGKLVKYSLTDRGAWL